MATPKPCGGGVASFSFQSVAGPVYALQYKDRLTNPDWLELQTQTGTGGLMTLTDPNPPGPSRFYRVILR